MSIGFAGGNPTAVDFAYQVESALPYKWDVVAFCELAWFRRRNESFKAVREGALPAEGVLRLYATNGVPQLPFTARDQDPADRIPALIHRLDPKRATRRASSAPHAQLTRQGCARGSAAFPVLEAGMLSRTTGPSASWMIANNANTMHH